MQPALTEHNPRVLGLTDVRTLKEELSPSCTTNGPDTSESLASAEVALERLDEAQLKALSEAGSRAGVGVGIGSARTAAGAKCVLSGSLASLREAAAILGNLGQMPLGEALLRTLDARRRRDFKLSAGGREFDLSRKSLVMGVLNVTPDSFSDGGRYMDHAAAIERGVAMTEEGADIIDVGGESTRPGAAVVPVEEQLRRVLPVVRALSEKGTVVSIDTSSAVVARESLDAGAAIVNDVTALRGDPQMAEVVASACCDCVLMHMQGTPQTMQQNPRYRDVIDDISAFFEERMSFAIQAGIEEDALWLDPGFGFGKMPLHNLEILRRLGEFKKFGRPLLIGTSNKGTIGAVLGTPVNDRLEGTAATVALAIANGADCVRVHDVRAMMRVVRMTDAVVHPKH